MPESNRNNKQFPTRIAKDSTCWHPATQETRAQAVPHHCAVAPPRCGSKARRDEMVWSEEVRGGGWLVSRSGEGERSRSRGGIGVFLCFPLPSEHSKRRDAGQMIFLPSNYCGVGERSELPSAEIYIHISLAQCVELTCFFYNKILHTIIFFRNKSTVQIRISLCSFGLLATSTFLSEQTSHQHTFLSEQTSTNHQPPAKRRAQLCIPSRDFIIDRQTS
jgi:hypothetical protein